MPAASDGGASEERDRELTLGSPGNQAVKHLQRAHLEEIGTAGALVPAAGTTALSGGTKSSAVRVTPDDYVGSAADRTGFAGLEAIEDVTMLCVPDLMAAYERDAVDLDGVKAVQLAMIAHCELMADRVAILD
ncbi:MAG TPA: phage tail sheath family protein, partial [Pseudonocardiaceae bacterium]|nr:phage tail sheath family protein [Pseudonocardiaceae bacterium]